jgi:hypothetical protein
MEIGPSSRARTSWLAVGAALEHPVFVLTRAPKNELGTRMLLFEFCPDTVP